MKRIAIVVSHPIQHFCPQYASFAGNSEIVLKVFFGSSMGHKTYFDKTFKKEVSWSNLYLDKFDHIFLDGGSGLPVNANLDSDKIESELKLFKPDIVITYGYFQKIQRRVQRWARKMNVAIAYIADSERSHREGMLKSLAKWIYLRYYFRRINFFLTVGDSNEAYYRHYGVADKRLIRMHFPIDVNVYEKDFARNADLRAKVRTQYGILEGEVVFAVVGKLVAWKNQDHLIDALFELEKKNVIAHLFIIGSGEMIDAWKEKSQGLRKSKVHFTGFVAPEDLPGYYAASDTYVHPASFEPHSLAISEAIFMGKPIIVSDRCGSYGDHDDVTQGKNGFVYTWGNIDELSERMKELSDSPTLREQFGTASRSRSVTFQRSAHQGVISKLIEAHGG